ncbi:MAG: hypothetical protein AAGE59_39405 [Cyanobacteria bacterium P01_F01_bin.86]
MPIVDAQIKGLPLTNEPPDVARCGLSLAQFAKDCRTHQWYQLSTEGPVIGEPTDFDFYRNVDENRSGIIKDKALTTV